MAEPETVRPAAPHDAVVIRPIRDSDDRERLLGITRCAYERHLDRGLNYSAGKRSVEEFQQFVEGAEACFVAEVGGELVGTICCGWPKGGCGWYEQPGVFTSTQLAVDPAYQRRGIGRKLKEAVEQKALDCGAVEIAIDTASDAHDVIAFNRAQGFRLVDRLRWTDKTYESVVLSKRLAPQRRVRVPVGRRLRWWVRRKRVEAKHLPLSALPRWFRGLRRIWWMRPRLGRRSAARRVLLVAPSPMMLPYLFDVVDLLEGDSRVEVRAAACDPPSSEAGAAVRRQLAERGIPVVNAVKASCQDWDCVVFADHGVAHHFSRKCVKVLNWHSIDGSKVLPESGEVYRYCRRMTVDKRGRAVYDCMFDASEASRDGAVSAVREVEGRVVVVGDRRADRLRELEADRDRVRREMVIGKDETAVLIGSTFGSECLFETIGEKLLEEAVRLKDRYRFILSAHPHLWTSGESGGRGWGERLLACEREHGFVVHRQPGDLFPYLAAADLLVTDFGSLVVNYALLGKPVAFVPFPEGIVSPQSFVSQIMQISPRLERAEDLPQVLAGLQDDYPTAQLKKIAQQIVSCPGEADDRMRRELYRLLRLEPPEVGATRGEAASDIGLTKKGGT